MPFNTIRGQKILLVLNGIIGGTMQSYNNPVKDGNLCKRLLSEFFGFMKYKVDNDLLTMDEVLSIGKILRDNIPVSGTAEDFSKFYGQPIVNVRMAISRKYIGKPTRKVLYSFYKFFNIAPSKWHKSNK